MEKHFDLEDILAQWKNSYCKLDHGKISGAAYFKVPPDSRYELFQILVQKIKDAGKPKEWFIRTNKEKIVKDCLPPEHCLDKQTYNKSFNASMNHMNMAVAAIYPDQERVVLEKKKVIAKPKELWDPKSIKSDEPPVEEVPDPIFGKLLGFDDE